MKSICVVTATRAEYGLLKNTILELQKQEGLSVRVVVTGAHLCERFGATWQEIEADGITIAEKIDIGVDEVSAQGVSETMARAIAGFAAYFAKETPDALLVLGDRYETLAICMAAMNQQIPIFHMCGGETTQGAVDEGIRHAITKLSYLHFAQLEAYRKRIIQMGEAPERVFTVGAPGVENALKTSLLSKEELEKSIGFSLDKPFGLVTFHPVTLEAGTEGQQVQELIKALESCMPEMKFIITGANADRGGNAVNAAWAAFAEKHAEVLVIPSLGMRRYLSALRYCSVVIGNSSSGILEAPSFLVGTVNIGDRQKGRLQAASVYNTAPEKTAILTAIRQAVQAKAENKFAQVQNPYGKGNTSKEVADIIAAWLLGERIQLKKPFYDVEFEVKE